MTPELGKDYGPWNALELAVRPKALGKNYRMRLSSCISDLQPMAARSTSQPEINSNFLTATWSTNYTGLHPSREKYYPCLLAVTTPLTPLFLLS